MSYSPRHRRRPQPFDRLATRAALVASGTLTAVLLALIILTITTSY